MSLREKKLQLIEELKYIEDPTERFTYIIDRAKEKPPLDPAFHLDLFQIEGCLSKLWLYPEYKEGKCHFSSDADAVITKGVAALLCDLYDNTTPAEILEEDASFLKEVGITQHLSPNRRNGLTNLTKRIQDFARHCLA
jgi:cysteine desulfuration protein SufE